MSKSQGSNSHIRGKSWMEWVAETEYIDSKWPRRVELVYRDLEAEWKYHSIECLNLTVETERD
jgi:hypothetical protein